MADDFGTTVLTVQPHYWACANCGWKAEESIDTCPNCGNRIWGKINRVQKINSGQVATPNETWFASTPTSAKLLKADIAHVSDLFNSVECSACNAIIYTPKGKFDREVFEGEQKKHYAESPGCKPEST